MSQNPWAPGSVRRLPWLGLGALLGAVAALAASIGILVISNGQPISTWKVQPSVYLAITVPIINLLLTFALSEGVDIAFWRKATKSGTTVVDLHRIWDFGKSFKSAIFAGVHTNLVAVACIFAVVVQINSPLLQRASRVVEGSKSSVLNVYLDIARDIPYGYYTGYSSGRGSGTSVATLYSQPWLPVVNGWYSGANASIPEGHGCDGTCRTRVQGVGLAISCSTSTMPFNLSVQYPTDGSAYNMSNDPVWTGGYIFGAEVSMWFDKTDGIRLNSLYKDTHDCWGTLQAQECNLTYATVEYPVVIDGNRSTISLEPKSTIWEDSVLNTSTAILNTSPGLQPHTGVLLAMFNRYNSSAHMRFAGAVGYEVKTSGANAQSYARVLDDGTQWAFDAGRNCTLGFVNPMDDMIAGARDLVFRTGIAVAQFNSSFATTQSLLATQTDSRAVFRSNYAYIGAAIAVTFAAMIPIILVFRDYSSFGRPCSSSPIAVAHAFDAPLLRAHDSNMPIEKLVEEIGSRSVKYGTVHVNNIDAATRLTGYKDMSSTAYEVYSQEVVKLCMADEDIVSEPKSGQVFTG